MDHEDRTVFHVAADGVELEFAGTEAFVTRQVERFRSFLERAIGFVPLGDADSAGAASPHANGATSALPPSFADFAAARPIREGRGAIQDRILLAIHHMEANAGRQGATTDDITFCFTQAGWDVPNSLHNHLGILKRKKGLLDDGAGRGLYRLSDDGRRYVEQRLR